MSIDTTSRIGYIPPSHQQVLRFELYARMMIVMTILVTSMIMKVTRMTKRIIIIGVKRNRYWKSLLKSLSAVLENHKHLVLEMWIDHLILHRKNRSLPLKSL